MARYQSYNDVKVSHDEGLVRWVDYGEVRHLEADEARWLGQKLLYMAARAEAHNDD